MSTFTMPLRPDELPDWWHDDEPLPRLVEPAPTVDGALAAYPTPQLAIDGLLAAIERSRAARGETDR